MIDYSYITKYYLTRYQNTRVINNKYYETRNKLEIPESDEDEYVTIDSSMLTRLDILSKRFYDNPDYYWIIAEANNIIDVFDPIPIGTTIRIPPLANVTKLLGVV